MESEETIMKKHQTTKELLNKNLDISELVNRLMFKRKEQLDLQYVSLKPGRIYVKNWDYEDVLGSLTYILINFKEKGSSIFT